ncbi:hypothetical protein GUJ93_ZPchr0012g22223 [Zizania palustris]|uniref:Uncharacterized protein n=1 Tax=Zizania palustris TaxID=103762 RepID=A0A8J6BUI0_ZIZPA|nr:hypothetical protein GUJ93_ZPchr0012g22223 [Zizania palustris]
MNTRKLPCQTIKYNCCYIGFIWHALLTTNMLRPPRRMQGTGCKRRAWRRRRLVEEEAERRWRTGLPQVPSPPTESASASGSRLKEVGTDVGVNPVWPLRSPAKEPRLELPSRWDGLRREEGLGCGGQNAVDAAFLAGSLLPGPRGEGDGGSVDRAMGVWRRRRTTGAAW